jgi:hypothetical protein
MEECVYQILCKSQENWDQTCDKTAFQDKAMSHTEVFKWFLFHIKDEHKSVEVMSVLDILG